MSMDVIAKLKAQAATPGRIWLRGAVPVTYADLLAETGRMANALMRLGLHKGDRLLLQVEKSEAVLTLYLACLRAGVVFLPVNPGYTMAETTHFLTDAEPALVLFDDDRAHGISENSLQVIALQDFIEIASQESSLFEDPVPSADDLAAILYTSGTTGRSKGVMLSRENLASNAEALVGLWRFAETDVLLHVLPVFHTHGLFVATNCALYSGASLLFQRSFAPDAVLAALPEVTVMMGVPTFYSRLLADQRLTPEACASLRLFISGSAPLSPAVHAEWQGRTGKAILERYGMTETSMITSNPYDGERRAGTVGMPLPGVQVRISGPEGTLPIGAAGSIEVRGPNVFGGYWRMPEQTAKEFRDGWFVTGDLGAFDADGYLSILGRAKDLVITGGLNVYPAEVEAAIDDLPGVAASAVIGVPHPDFGEAVVACVTGTAEPEAIRATLRDRLAGFKIPKRVLMLDALPRNAMGKVQKAELRRQFAGLFD